MQMEVAFLMSLLSFQGSRSGHFYPAVAGEVAQTFRSNSEQRAKGEAAKQRASEQPVFMNLSLERVCMKMWCLLNRDPAINGANMIVVE
jgi:hypothetical protein